MGKKGSNKNVSTGNSGQQMSVTLREASTGKKHTNVKSALKLEHLKNLAVWASHDAAVPSLGAFFGHHFAASSEALATPVDPSLFTCLRCESILHPGNNCTIRIEKYKANARQKRKKSTNYPQNNIVYTCHFCSHRNIKRGTPRNTSAPKVRAHRNAAKRKTINAVSSSDMTKDNVVANVIAAPLGAVSDNSDTGKIVIEEVKDTLKLNDESADINNIGTTLGFTIGDISEKMGILDNSETTEVKNDCGASCPTTPSTRPATPSTRPPLTFLEIKMGKRNRSKSKKKVTSETPKEEKSVTTSKKKRRKSWTSLKEIAENDNSKRSMNFTIPFSMQ